MLKIRLQRIGRRNEAHFRVVVIEASRGAKTGNFVERVGSYNPKTKDIQLNEERITHWIGNGAQPSDTVHNMLVKKGVIKGKAKNVLPKKTVQKKEGEEVAAPAATEEAKPEEAPAASEEESTEEAGDTAEEKKDA